MRARKNTLTAILVIALPRVQRQMEGVRQEDLDTSRGYQRASFLAFERRFEMDSDLPL